MKPWRIVILILLSGCITEDAFPDAFPKSSEALGGPVFSLEFLGSCEKSFKSGAGLLAWGGLAGIFSPYGLDFNAGPEAALELRKYFHERDNLIWSFSLYTGAAYNLVGNRYGAFTPGVKITRKKSAGTALKLEPYLSLSYPFYFEGGHPWLPFLTFGYRIVMEKSIY